jgi:hypothetical protein
MSEYVKRNFDTGKYKSINDPMEFSARLTEDLQSISKDLHLNIGFAPDQIRSFKESKIDSSELLTTKKQEKFTNYGFAEVKALPYGIGYLKLNSFSGFPEAMDVAAGAMNFLANSNAVIIDLRENDGGDPKMIQFITSYILGDSIRHLNSFYIRESNTTTQFWTLPAVPGKKIPHAEIFILTSKQTISAAEEFAYNLKNMKRATIIGETTAGAANPSVIKIINDNFAIMLPIGMAINPITKTNWEGTGVEPDIKTTNEKAFDTAYLIALKSQMEKEKEVKIKSRYLSVIESIDAKNNPVVLDEESKLAYAGNYGPRKIFIENGGLVYQREERPKQKMIFIKKDVFELEGTQDFQLVFVWESHKVVAVEGHYADGRVTRNDRDR